MNTYSRIFAALLLAGAASNLSACGDDEGDDTKKDSGVKDSGVDKDSGEDPDPDAGEPPEGDGGEEGDGSTDVEEDPPEELPACPTHTNVTTSGNFCVLNASLGNEIKTDLALAPVKGKMGYLISKGVFVGEDVGGKAAPDAAKKKATLSIGKGTTLYGADSLSFLLVNRGSKLVAEGSKKYPVVFTTGAESPKPGRWGGVIINGRAPSNRADANGDVVGEAGTGKYSGPDAADNSGVVKYVRIEFGGGKIDDKNELNGLALQGVGSGTKVDYVHIHANDDDGIEFFGGTVDAKHIIVTAFADDGIDWTDGWSGRLQFAIAQQWNYTNPGTGTNDASNGIEADNSDAKATATPFSAPVMSNVTLVGDPAITAPVGGNGLVLRRGTQGQLHNFVVLNFKNSCISLRGTDSAGFAGKELALLTSRTFCTTPYESHANTAVATDPAAAAALFDATGANNDTFADADSALTDPYAQTAAADFTPLASSGLLEGGKVPSDSFFEKVEYIGALGDAEENWTAGEWFKVTPFTP